MLCAPLGRQEGQLHAFRAVFGDANVRAFDFITLQSRGVSPGEITKRFAKLAGEFKPDWIWLQLQGSVAVEPDGIQEVKRLLPDCLVTHWMGDAQLTVDQSLAKICQVTDATLISSVGQIPLYQDAGAAHVYYVQIGLDWVEDVLGEPAWTPPFAVPDVVFIGNYYGADYFQQGTDARIAAIKHLHDKGINIGVVGHRWPYGLPVVGHCAVKQQHHVWRQAKIALSINHFNDIERYYSDRQLVAMASGTPVVCHYVPGLEHEFMQGRDCFWYRDGDLNQLTIFVEELLRNPDLRRQMGRAARFRVMREHTWQVRILDLLPTIESLRDKLHV